MIRSASTNSFALSWRHLLTAVAMATTLAFGLSNARASTQDGQRPLVQTTPNAASSELFDLLDDIDRLNVINPLHLTPEQIGRIIDLIKTAQANYSDNINELCGKFLSQYAGDIRRQHASSMLGAQTPDNFITLVGKLLTLRLDLQAQSASFVATGMKKILDPGQRGTIVSLAKQYGGSGNGSEDQWMTYYSLNVLLRYPKIVHLLQEMKSTAQKSG